MRYKNSESFRGCILAQSYVLLIIKVTSAFEFTTGSAEHSFFFVKPKHELKNIYLYIYIYISAMMSIENTIFRKEKKTNSFDIIIGAPI